MANAVKGKTLPLTFYVVAAAFFLVTTAFGVLAIPKFAMICAGLVPGGEPPILARAIVAVGSSGYLAIALFGTVALFLTAKMRHGSWMHNVVIILLAAILGLTVVGMFWSTLQMIRQPV